MLWPLRPPFHPPHRTWSLKGLFWLFPTSQCLCFWRRSSHTGVSWRCPCDLAPSVLNLVIMLNLQQTVPYSSVLPSWRHPPGCWAPRSALLTGCSCARPSLSSGELSICSSQQRFVPCWTCVRLSLRYIVASSLLHFAPLLFWTSVTPNVFVECPMMLYKWGWCCWKADGKLCACVCGRGGSCGQGSSL